MGRSAARNICRIRKVREKIKKRYLPDIPHAELPSQKRIIAASFSNDYGMSLNISSAQCGSGSFIH